jgi:hypothetical protein
MKILTNSDYPNDKRKKFYPHITLGSLVATITFAGACIGIYTQLYADVSNHKIEIQNIKINEVKREAADKEYREDIKQQTQDIKSDVKEVQRGVQQILIELGRAKERENARKQ